jgi:hypothetical protein
LLCSRRRSLESSEKPLYTHLFLYYRPPEKVDYGEEHDKTPQATVQIFPEKLDGVSRRCATQLRVLYIVGKLKRSVVIWSVKC